MKKALFSLIAIATMTYSASTMDMQILDATIKSKPVAGAQVIFQRNGQSSVTANTDASGKISIPMPFGVDDENTTILVKKSGFSTLVVKGPADGLTYAISPTMAELDGLRVVLSWGSEPYDLDSHISFPQNHIYYQQKEGTKANLDVDDTDQYGPETITIIKKFQNQKYVYAVHNYSDGDDATSSRLSQVSGAKVFVYIGNTLIKTYYVPKNRTGNLWVVFAIDENGEFQDINQFKQTNGVEQAYGILKAYRNDTPVLTPVSATLQAQSKELDRQGANLYHAGKYTDAVVKYNRAIELDPNNGQAYSDLGLNYQKMGRIAEALWASRKSIALAHGEQKAVTQACSYYNIATMYESQGKWEDALDNFESALQRRDHPAYNSGISRMKAKLGQ